MPHKPSILGRLVALSIREAWTTVAIALAAALWRAFTPSVIST